MGRVDVRRYDDGGLVCCSGLLIRVFDDLSGRAKKMIWKAIFSDGIGVYIVLRITLMVGCSIHSSAVLT